MKGASDDRRLTIGAYAAATQLTAKALRLYDEHGLLRPDTTDASSGYRYYRVEQVATGRLIRGLREMNLSLPQIAQVLDAPLGLRPVLLRSFLQDAEQRLARERTAYQAALVMMRTPMAAPAVQIEEHTAPAQVTAVYDFISNRRAFIEHALQHRSTNLAQLASLGLHAQAECAFALVEPLTDEEGRIELLIPIEVAADSNLQGVTVRHVPRRRYVLATATPAAFGDGFSSCIDALFDWFDRRGMQAVGYPEVVLVAAEQDLSATIRWAFDADNGG